MGDILKQQGANFEYANARLEDRAAIVSEIDRVRPWHSAGAAYTCMALRMSGRRMHGGKPHAAAASTHGHATLGRPPSLMRVCAQSTRVSTPSMLRAVVPQAAACDNHATACLGATAGEADTRAQRGGRDRPAQCRLV